jgi:hypothetical protein
MIYATITSSLDYMLMTKLVIQNLNYTMVLLILKLVTTWHL